MRQVAVALSRSGSLLPHIHNALLRRQDAKLAAVFCSRRDCYGYERAVGLELPIFVVPPEEVCNVCRQQGIDLLCLAGYLKKLMIPDDFAGRVMNIHPSLLPAFGGKGMYAERVHRAVVEAGVKVTGCTVHYVDNEYDTGPIIVQRVYPLEGDETPEQVSEAVGKLQQAAYVTAIHAHLDGVLRVEGRRVLVS